jgi:hypothetical protein
VVSGPGWRCWLPDRPVLGGTWYRVITAPGNALVVYEVWESQQAIEEYGRVLVPIWRKAWMGPGTPDVMPVHNLAGLTRGWPPAEPVGPGPGSGLIFVSGVWFPGRAIER